MIIIWLPLFPLHKAFPAFQKVKICFSRGFYGLPNFENSSFTWAQWAVQCLAGGGYVAQDHQEMTGVYIQPPVQINNKLWLYECSCTLCICMCIGMDKRPWMQTVCLQGYASIHVCMQMLGCSITEVQPQPVIQYFNCMQFPAHQCSDKLVIII